MLVEQEFDTPGDALVHYGKKGMRWGHRSAVKSASTAVSNKTQSAKQGVQGAASRTAGGISNSAKGAKAKTTGAVNNKVQGAKAGAQARADAKKQKIADKAQKVGENPTVKGAGREVKGVVWGTRKAYLEKTLKDAERAGNIGKGTAGIDSKVIAAKDLIVTKRQARVAEKVFANHAKRMQEGKLKTRDVLLMSARLRRRDLTIGMDLAGKKNDRAKKRGREVNFDIPKIQKA